MKGRAPLHLQPILGRGVLKFEVAEAIVGLQRKLLLRTDEIEMRVARAQQQLQFRLGIAAVDLGREATCAGVLWPSAVGSRVAEPALM